ncbi:MAG: hypothetical protein GYB68_12245 [Chloroflexi bacterium]|nr:hypothetical protein [Chloroflexota bacterium]
MPTYSMSALAADLEARIRATRLIDFDVPWADELVFPAFDGLSIRNVPHSIGQFLGQAMPAPLDAALWDGEAPDVDRVVLFISDGLGYLWLSQLLEEDAELAELTSRLTDGRGPLPLTSIAPSTTSVALPTIWTGATPAQHGMIGLTLHLRQASTTANMLYFRPQQGNAPYGALEEWGIKPEQVMSELTISQRLLNGGVPTHLVIQRGLVGTGLSRIIHRKVRQHYEHGEFSDLWLRAEDALRETVGQRAYLHIYWHGVDRLSHGYGAHNRYVHNEIKQQFRALVNLLDQPELQDGRTLFMLIADHGHYDVPNAIKLHEGKVNQPILDAMQMHITSDPRLGYLHLHPDLRDAAIAVIDEHYREQLAWVDAKTALNAGLFGPEPHHPEVKYRLGDVLLLARRSWQVNDWVMAFPTPSLHGGLDEWEMLVPLLWRVI